MWNILCLWWFLCKVQVQGTAPSFHFAGKIQHMEGLGHFPSVIVFYIVRIMS